MGGDKAISLAALAAAFCLLCIEGGGIPTTLDGPFNPITVPLDTSFRGNAEDLPHTDPRLQRNVQGFQPEQISITLSATYDSVWISWVTGLFLFFSFFHFSLFLSLWWVGLSVSTLGNEAKHWLCFVSHNMG